MSAEYDNLIQDLQNVVKEIGVYKKKASTDDKLSLKKEIVNKQRNKIKENKMQLTK